MQTEKLSLVYNWASQLTSETIGRQLYDKNEAPKFYETRFFKLLCWKIRNTPHALIAVSGLQGSGKTRILLELQKDFPKSIYCKWSRNWLKEALTWDSTRMIYTKYVQGEGEGIYDELSAKEKNKLINKYAVRSMEFEDFPFFAMEKIVGKSQCNEFKREAAMQVFEGSDLILLDMPDYNKYTPSLMNLDFDELQRFWGSLTGSKAKFVIAFQKELIMRNPHFFIGKLDLMDLEPLSTQELIEAYNICTGDTELFSQEALTLLAQLSRGIFRRFKKYIRSTIEGTMEENLKANREASIPLTPEHVNKAITEKVLSADLELELCDVFKEKEKRTQAIGLLNQLRVSSPLNQKEAAKFLSLSEATTGKLINKLLAYRYIERKRGEGAEWIISLC